MKEKFIEELKYLGGELVGVKVKKDKHDDYRIFVEIKNLDDRTNDQNNKAYIKTELEIFNTLLDNNKFLTLPFFNIYDKPFVSIL